jgi:protein TonB
MAQLTGAEGTVVLAMDLNAKGQVLDGRVKTSSGHRSLDEATLRAVRRCDFTPATQNGEAVAITGVMEFEWRLD